MTCKHGKFFRILMVLFFVNGHLFAQDSSVATADSATTIVDSINDDSYIADTIINQTIFNDKNDSIVKWKSSREFGYMVYLDSLLHKKKDLKQDTIDIENGSGIKSKAKKNSSVNSNANAFLNSSPVKVFFWILAIFFIGFILYKLFFKSGLFARERITEDTVADEEPEKLNEFSEYITLIKEAESLNNFNLAIRYLYLQTLKRLSERELILFSPDKTNKLYVQELSGQIFQPQFESLTHNYEYVWYGKFSINNITYQQLKEQFTVFNNKV